MTELVAIARRYGFNVESCAEPLDLAHLGVEHGRCIDTALLNRLFGLCLRQTKDLGQRPACGCARAIDIGQYNCCPQGCRYCYANHSRAAALRGLARHDPHSDFLLD